MRLIQKLFRISKWLTIVSIVYLAATSVATRFSVQSENETLKLQLRMLAQKYASLAESQASLGKSIQDLEVSSEHLVDETLKDKDVLQFFKAANGPDMIAVEALPAALMTVQYDSDELFESAMHQAEAVDHNLKVLQKQLQGLSLVLAARGDLLNALPNGHPTAGWISSGFGMRKSPIHGRRVMHRGIDIAASKGTPVYATADGVVHLAGNKGSYGKLVTVNHGYGITTRYAHNFKLFVATGEVVKKGQKIALVGNTGRTTGEHLHYEIWFNDQPVDPKFFMNDSAPTTAKEPTLALDAPVITDPFSNTLPYDGLAALHMGGEEDLGFDALNFSEVSAAQLDGGGAMKTDMPLLVSEEFSDYLSWRVSLVLCFIAFGFLGLWLFILKFQAIVHGPGRVIFRLIDFLVAKAGDRVQDSAM